jgi:hypothetical protein
MNGLQGTLQGCGVAQLLQSEVGLFTQQRTHLALVLGDDQGLAPGQVMAGRNIACMAALLDQFLDHPKGNPKAPGRVLSGAFLCIVSSQYSLPKIQGNGSSIAHAITPTKNPSKWLYYLLNRSNAGAKATLCGTPHQAVRASAPTGNLPKQIYLSEGTTMPFKIMSWQKMKTRRVGMAVMISEA